MCNRGAAASVGVLQGQEGVVLYTSVRAFLHLWFCYISRHKIAVDEHAQSRLPQHHDLKSSSGCTGKQQVLRSQTQSRRHAGEASSLSAPLVTCDGIEQSIFPVFILSNALTCTPDGSPALFGFLEQQQK